VAQMIIYILTNLINNKIYVGQTVRSLEKRINQHLKRSDCIAISSAIKKYGIESFKIEQIDSAETIEELNKKENEWILKLNTVYPNGYNLNTGGLNKRWSEFSKIKMSNSHKGKKLSQEHKINISNSVKSVFRKNPEKLILPIIALKNWNKAQIEKGFHPKRGKKLSEESKKNISNSKLGEKNPMFGKKLNKKQLQNIKTAQQKRIDNLPSILCHQNGKVYRLVTDAAKDLNVSRSSVSNVLIGHRKSCKGYTFEYVRKNSNE
jgi:group I intron endonuclease